ncbi:unnamed protein product [Ambrosiozyma monospora]|uniref:Unnamed protein product n=1 Tax=Ambrosiozyma monospora TaxID=43982 RepID=A0A9W6YYE8_AMBMO|nr:unnamed protein product [Ambrosiozyma monospora]
MSPSIIEPGGTTANYRNGSIPQQKDKHHSSGTLAQADLSSSSGPAENQNQHQQEQQQVIVNTLSSNNAFISSLDHLPCDIVRSLWIIQSLNLKSEKLHDELNELLKFKTPTDPNNTVNNKTRESRVLDLKIYALEKQLKWTSSELNAQSKQLRKTVRHHLSYLEHDLSLMNQLVTYHELTAPELTSADARNWDTFTKFKKEYLKVVRSTHDEPVYINTARLHSTRANASASPSPVDLQLAAGLQSFSADGYLRRSRRSGTPRAAATAASSSSSQAISASSANGKSTLASTNIAKPAVVVEQSKPVTANVKRAEETSKDRT